MSDQGQSNQGQSDQGQSDQGRDQPVFHIGLTMAGAISAGAYSAGVLDFLIEALDQWEQAKTTGNGVGGAIAVGSCGVPQHDVFLSTLSGASAGGVVGALGLIALSSGVRPVEEPAANREQTWPVRRVLPELYDAWVRRPSLAGLPGGKGRIASGGLLGQGDMTGKAARVLSALDSTALEKIATDAVNAVRPIGRRYGFLTEPFHLFLTVTNLDGVPYRMPFGPGGSGGHSLTLHADRAHFAVQGLGGRPFPTATCQWLERWGDTGIGLDLSPAGGGADAGLQALVTATLATCAYPLALQPRLMMAMTSHYAARAWPVPDEYRVAGGLQPDWQAGANGSRDYKVSFVGVDGGALDNEPFELARWSIRNLDEEINPRDAWLADRAVIIINPFPAASSLNPDSLNAVRSKGVSPLAVAKALLPALREQARFKVTDLFLANDENVYSRFLIAPRRTAQDVTQTPALASSVLQAFGGFLDEPFREHDFQLGRRNCQQFLRTSFQLDRTNPLFARSITMGLYAGTPAGEQLPVIPLIGTAAREVQLPPWPKMAQSRLAELETSVRDRLRLVCANIFETWNVPAFAKLVGRYYLLPEIPAKARSFRLLVESELLWNDQLHAHPGVTGRKPAAVLAALIDPNWHWRTVPGITAEYSRRNGGLLAATGAEARLTGAEAREILERLGSQIVTVGRDGGDTAYALKAYDPRRTMSWFGRLQALLGRKPVWNVD